MKCIEFEVIKLKKIYKKVHIKLIGVLIIEVNMFKNKWNNQMEHLVSNQSKKFGFDDLLMK